MARRPIKRKEQKTIAKERIEILLNLAKDEFPMDRELSRRYVKLSRRIGSRYNVRLQKKEKAVVCRGCNSLLVPGVNLRVRTHDHRVVMTCLDCGRVRRIPSTRERKGKVNKESDDSE